MDSYTPDSDSLCSFSLGASLFNLKVCWVLRFCCLCTLKSACSEDLPQAKNSVWTKVEKITPLKLRQML